MKIIKLYQNSSEMNSTSKIWENRSTCYKKKDWNSKECGCIDHMNYIASHVENSTENTETVILEPAIESKEYSMFKEFRDLRGIKHFNELQEVQEFQHVIIEYSREITKRIEIEKRFEFDLLKLKLDHELDMFELKMKYENMNIKKNK